MKILERLRRIWQAEKANDRVHNERFIALAQRATGPAAWVLCKGDAAPVLIWLHVDDDAAVRAAALANYRPVGVLALCGGKICREVEPGMESMMELAFTDFVLACAALHGVTPSAAA